MFLRPQGARNKPGETPSGKGWLLQHRNATIIASCTLPATNHLDLDPIQVSIIGSDDELVYA